MQVRLRYGSEGLLATLPDGNVTAVLHLNRVPLLPDPLTAVREALQTPIGSPPLRDVARGRPEACVVISDITRPVPNRLILPPLLHALADAGLGPERVTILVGTGLHRPNTDDELREMVGEGVFGCGARFVNHVARSVSEQVELGTTPGGVPVVIDRTYVEAGLKILTGLIEPHLMAGYSGGRKAICPGISGLETIKAWHGPRLLEPAECRAGNILGNVEHEEALAVGRAAGADFIVNVTMDDQRRVTGVFAGDMEQAHMAGMAYAERQCKVVVAEPVDIVLTTNAGYPLDLTFYQGVKGMSAALPILRRGGTIIAAHKCEEGIGNEEFTRLLLQTPDIEEYVAATYRPDVFTIDQWQFHMMAKVLRHADAVLNLSDGIDYETLSQCFVTPIRSVEEGIERALRKHGPDATIAAIPDGPYVLPCLRDDRLAQTTVGSYQSSVVSPRPGAAGCWCQLAVTSRRSSAGAGPLLDTAY